MMLHVNATLRATPRPDDLTQTEPTAGTSSKYLNIMIDVVFDTISLPGMHASVIAKVKTLVAQQSWRQGVDKFEKEIGIL